MLLIDRVQTSDALARPASRATVRTLPAGAANPEQQETRNEGFQYTRRGELAFASVNGRDFRYLFDNIGNRSLAQEDDNQTAYTANRLNQYDRIAPQQTSSFLPEYDADGNQSVLRTSTGDWLVNYDANDRPVRFSNADCDVSCQYDSKGRRYSQKVVRNGQTIRHLRYVYRGYLQIAALDLLNDGELLYSLLWDPTEETATRPLAMLKDGKTYYYAHDFNKNVAELLDDQGRLRATYDYAPFGQVSLNDPDSLGNPVQWSSEVHDPELGLVYYNFRHYNPLDGRWLSRDPIQESGGINLYTFSGNSPVMAFDILGLSPLNLYFLKITSAQQKEANKKSECSKKEDIGKIRIENGTIIVKTKLKSSYSSKIGSNLIDGLTKGIQSILENVLQNIAKLKKSSLLTTAAILDFEISEGNISAEITCCQCNKKTGTPQWSAPKNYFKASSDFPATFRRTDNKLGIEFNAGVPETLKDMAKSITESASKNCMEGKFD